MRHCSNICVAHNVQILFVVRKDIYSTKIPKAPRNWMVSIQVLVNYVRKLNGSRLSVPSSSRTCSRWLITHHFHTQNTFILYFCSFHRAQTKNRHKSSTHSMCRMLNLISQYQFRITFNISHFIHSKRFNSYYEKRFTLIASVNVCCRIHLKLKCFILVLVVGMVCANLGLSWSWLFSSWKFLFQVYATTNLCILIKWQV